MKTCIFDPSCTEPRIARGLCSPHYYKLKYSGELDSVALPHKHKAPQHRLSNKNIEEKTATCAVCGPVSIVEYVPSRKKWRCYFKANASRTAYHFAGGRISSFDALEARRELFKAQGGICDICKERPATHLDHCHTTGKIRGLLCTQCNTGLGMFFDRTDVLRAAIDYLNR
jgi:hypothetical protein